MDIEDKSGDLKKESDSCQGNSEEESLIHQGRDEPRAPETVAEIMAGINVKTNTRRLSRLLVILGTKALRNTFHMFHPPPTLSTFLAKNQAKLKTLLKKRIINHSQWELLFPAIAQPDSKTFDITLLSVLLQYICSLPIPATGWFNMPLDTDRSLEANIIRIRVYRNEILAHATSTTRVNEDQFDDLQARIFQTLIELGVSGTEIADLSKSPLNPEEENHIETLKVWESRDDKMPKTLEMTTTKICKAVVEIQPMTRLQLEVSNQRHAKTQLQRLSKFCFDGDIDKLIESFQAGTREWLFRLVEKWFSRKKPNVFVVTAEHGFGKSVFAAKICERFKDRQSLAACHFCLSNYKIPLRLIESLASNLCDSVKGFESKLLEQLKRHHDVENVYDAFQVYLKDPLQQLSQSKPMLIVIDGLDECESEGKNELLRVLEEEFSTLPSWLKVLMTSHPQINVKKMSRSLKYIEITPKNRDNKRDIKQYLTASLPQLHYKKRVISLLTEKCEGSFLFAFLLQRCIQNHVNITNEEEIEHLFPEGLSSVYHNYFAHLEQELKAFSDQYDIFHFLKVIAVAYSPTPLSFFTEGLELPPNSREIRKIIENVNKNVANLLYVDDHSVTVFHISVVEWILDKEHEYRVSYEEATTLLWKLMEKVFKEIRKNFLEKNYGSNIHVFRESKVIQYAFEYGFDHLFAAANQNSSSENVNHEWLVDVVLLHVIMTTSNQKCLSYRRRFLHGMDTYNDDENQDHNSNDSMTNIREKVNWSINHISSHTDVSPIYVQDVFNEGPSYIFSDEEKDIAKVILNKHLYFWCEKLNCEPSTPTIHVIACAFSPNGSHLVSCAAEGSIQIWSTNSDFQIVQDVLSDCKKAIRCFWSEEIVIFHYDEGNLMLTRCPVDQRSNLEVKKMTTKMLVNDKDKPLAFSPGAFLYKCSNDSTIRVHRFTETNETKTSLPDLYKMDGFAVSRDGSSVLAADNEHYEVWKISENTSIGYSLVKSEKDIAEHLEGEPEILRCAISSNDKFGIISCFYSTDGYDPQIFLLDIKSGDLKSINFRKAYPTNEVLLHADIKDDDAGVDDEDDDDKGDDDGDHNCDEMFMFIQNEKRIVVYSSKYTGPLTHFHHNGYPDYYKMNSLCRSGNFIALPQAPGGICFVKLHLPKPTKENLDSRFNEFKWR